MSSHQLPMGKALGRSRAPLSVFVDGYDGMWLSPSSLPKAAQGTHQKRAANEVKTRACEYRERKRMRRLCVLFGVSACDCEQTRTHMRYFAPCQRSKPD